MVTAAVPAGFGTGISTGMGAVAGAGGAAPLTLALALAALALWSWPGGPRLPPMLSDRGPRASAGVVPGEVTGARAGRAGQSSSVGVRPRVRHGVLAAGMVVLALVAPPAVAVAGALMLATGVRLLTRTRRRRADAAELAGLHTALVAIGRELAAGSNADTAVSAAAADAPPAVARGLAMIAAGEPPSGAASPAALGQLWHRVAAAWRIGGRLGIPLADLAVAAADDADALRRGAAARQTQTAGPVVSGYVLAALPVLGLLIGAGMGTDPLHVLTTTSIGGGLLAAGSALTCAGLLWTDRLVRGRR